MTLTQDLIDKHAGYFLNLIHKLPLTEDGKLILEIKLKELIQGVAEDVIKEAKEICFKAMEKRSDK